MPTIAFSEDRREYFTDDGGVATFFRDPESVADYTLDWRRVLGADTIASATWTASGVTLGTESSNQQTTSVVVSGSGDGEAKCIITTAAGRTHVRRLRFIARET